MAELECAVAVEKVVHKALRELAQALWDQHGICLKEARWSWAEAGTRDEPRMVLLEVVAETLTKAGE